MAAKDSIMGLQEIYCEAEGSNSGSDWDDTERDPDFDLLEETYSKFSNLSIKKAQARVFYGQDLRIETDPEELEMTAPGLDEKDEKIFEQVQKIIEAGVLEKLKVHECKLYLRKNGLRLTGNKDTLIKRIREHLEIIHDGGEKKYPPSSFVLNCKGDACTGDVVLFEQNVFEMFSIASRSASGPPCGQRIVAGRIVKESYGAAKQQHTFTIEVLWSKGEKPLPPLYPLLIKGRNLYRLKTLRQRWDDERERQKILMEKHSRGNVARADREARIQEKEKRKPIMKNRLSKKESLSNRSESHPLMTKSQFQPQESDILINSAKPDFSFDDGMKNRLSKKESLSNRFESHPLVTKSQFQPQESAILINSAKPDFSFDDGMKVATIPHQQMIYHAHDHQALKRSAECRITYDIYHTRRTELGENYNWPKIHSGEKRITSEKYPYSTETNQALKRSADCRITYDIHHTRRAELGENYNWPKFQSGEKQITIEKYPYSTETNRFAEWVHHRIPLRGVNHLLPLPSRRESYKQKQLCRHYAQGKRCHYGDNCKFLHDFREQVNRM